MSGQTASAAITLDTFPKWAAHHAKIRPEAPAMRVKNRGIWESWSWAELYAEVRKLAAGFAAEGLKRGDTIAIIGSNRPRLYWSVMAAQMLGAIPVPVYADAVADEMAYVLDHAEVKFASVEDQEQVDKVLSISERLPHLGKIFYDEERGLRDYDHTRLRHLTDVLNDGAKSLATDAGLKAMEAEIAKGNGDEISVILYTSGTTGRSKGVMMSSKGVIAACVSTAAFDKLDASDVSLAYLPLAWIGDHYMTYGHALVTGYTVACPESQATVEQCLREIGPTFYFAPPRVFENLLTRVTIRMTDASALKQKIFNHYLGVAKEWGEKILNGQSVPVSARLSYAIGNALVYAPLKNMLGFSKLKVAYTAGEAIGPELFSFYRSLGLNLKQLYAQTETCLYITAHPDGEIRADTVGRKAPGVEIRIAEDGEVQAKTPGQFVGYLKEPEKTAETMTPDGFIKTGDAGFFDATGHLKIIDRAKDVGKLASGALFAPKYIENKLKFYPNIKEVVAFGQGKDSVTCFINIDLTAVGNWAERNNVSYASYQELAGHPQVNAIIAGHVNEVNKSLASEPMMAQSQIKRFLILHKELDADDGELTRTQKVRRGFIAERYDPLIEALYNGASEASINTEVTFEDGRKGMISGRVKVMDATIYPATAAVDVRQAA